jgi:hypothetical protein
MKVTFTKLKAVGKLDKKYHQWRLTEEEANRKDIDPKALYAVDYDGTWLFGRFEKEWYGWFFRPNLSAICGLQLDTIMDSVYLVEGLKQKKRGNTTEHIMDYLDDEKAEAEERDAKSGE